MEQFIGKTIDHYLIEEPIGQGGMAVVYKAFDTRLERNVAIKMIRLDDVPKNQHNQMRKRFEREIKTLSRLNHPNIVQIYDFGEYHSQPYMVMEYLANGTLKSLIGKSMTFSEAANYLLPIANALEFAHKKGIYHRDVKPANILLDEFLQPKISDFGIVKLLEENANESITNTGNAVGTPEYMAPEQSLGKKIDGRTDEYALGIIFFELLTGQKPYHADTPAGILLKQVNSPIPNISNFPKEINKILHKTLAKEPENRYGTLLEFAVELEKIKNIQEQNNFSKNPVKNIIQSQKNDISSKTIDNLDLTNNSKQYFSTKTNYQIAHHKEAYILIAISMFLLLIGFLLIQYITGIFSPEFQNNVTTNIYQKTSIPEINNLSTTSQISDSLTNFPIENISPLSIALYDDFNDNLSGNWYLTAWSDLTDISIVESEGYLNFLAEGELSEYQSSFYYLDEEREITKFFSLVSVEEITSDGVFSITFIDEEGNWYNYGFNKFRIFISSNNIDKRETYPIPDSGSFWLGIETQKDQVIFYLENTPIYETSISGGIFPKNIGFEVGSTGVNGFLDINIEQVRIDFK